jgi:ABC-type bacteriocin/lantibiotic exporter with double-glycine peptidase domain
MAFVRQQADPARLAPAIQETSWSCGPAAVVSAARALGLAVTERHARALSEADPEGTDADQLLAALNVLGLAAEPGEFADEDEAREFLHGSLAADRPCILAVDDWEHWVVATGFDGDLIVVQDPGIGRVATPPDKLMRRWRHETSSTPFYAISVSLERG